MPNINNYIQKLKAVHPDRTVIKIYDFDENDVLAIAPIERGRQEFHAMFLISKSGSDVKPFVPFREGEKYLAAIHKDPLYEVT